MAKELIIVQGIYKVGADFPEGSYLFDSKGVETQISGDFKDYDGELDWKCFNLNEKNGYTCRLHLSKGEKITIDTKICVTKAEMLDFTDKNE